jgi:glycosyltransferase
MLEHADFKNQDFFSYRNNFSDYKDVVSAYISGNKDKTPFISIAIPTYKRPELLKNAILSCLNQKGFSDFNIVITDNDPAPDNETEVVIEEFNDERIIYYKNQQNIGPLANFNRCIEMAKADYVMMLHSDDLLYDDYLYKISRVIDKYEEIDVFAPRKDLVYNGHVVRAKGYFKILNIINKLNDTDNVPVKLELFDFVMFYPFIGPSGVVYKKKTFMESGGFNAAFHPTGDYILHAYMTLNYNVAITNINSGRYVFEGNISLESGMRTTYVIQYYFLSKYISRYLEKGNWVEWYYMGSIFYKLHRKTNKKYNIELNSNEIFTSTGKKANFFNYMFFIYMWVIAAVKFLIRLMKEARNGKM